MEKKKLVLIDGFSIVHRAFYGVPDLTNSKGIHTNAIYGFMNILFKILAEEQADYLAVAFDVSAPTFRHKMYDAYKGTRKPMPPELKEQIPILKEILGAMNIHMVEKAGYEADDILGTIALCGEKEGFLVSVVSGDKDLLQLATDSIKIRMPKTKRTGTEVEDYLRKDVLSKYGIEPPRIVDLKGLMGDASDNIPGVPGIGEKTALKLLLEFNSLENAYAHIEEVKPNRARENLREYIEQARLSYTLASIKTDCELEFDFEQALVGNLYTPEAAEILRELECKSLLSRFPSEEMPAEIKKEQLLLAGSKADAEAFFQRMKKEAAACEKNGTQLVISLLFYGKTRKERKNMEEADGQLVFPGVFDSPAAKDFPLGIALGYGSFPNGKPAGLTNWKESIFHLVKEKKEMETFVSLLQKELLPMEHSVIVTSDLKEQMYYFKMLFETAGRTDAKEQLRAVRDCKIAAYLCNPLLEDYEPEQLAARLWNLSLSSRKELFGKEPLSESIQTEAFPSYAGSQAAVLCAAYPVYFKEIKKYDMQMLYEEIEMPLVFTLYDMEERGVRVNKEALMEYGESLKGRIAELEKAIHDFAGEVFNINSPKQLGTILFEKLKLPGGKKTKTGYSTGAEVLEKLRDHLWEENKEAAKCLDALLEYRQLTKLKSTYADGLSVFIEEDQRIHGKLNQTVTATGRLSSTEPNLQNIPIRMELGKQIRKVFIPKENFLFLDADYSQIELRILAHMSGDEKLIAAYKKDEDIHRITASEVFHIPLEEVTPEQRRNAKAVNFGIVYGISSFGLGQDLNISKKEAQEYIERYFDTYPKVKEYLDTLVCSAKEKGYVESYYHRIRPIPELKSSSFMQRSFGERAAMNSPIQGTAADVMKLAMNRVNERLERENLESALLLQIHDELLVETKPEEKAKVRRILKEEMEQAADFLVPLVAEVEEGKNWMEAH